MPRQWRHRGSARLQTPAMTLVQLRYFVAAAEAGSISAAARREHVTQPALSRQVALLESQMYLRNQLLRDCDWASMAHGLEVRTPYVDARLAAQIGPMLAKATVGSGKRRLAATASPPLPEAVAARRKTGFGPPIRPGLEQEPRLAGSSVATGRQHWSRKVAVGVLAAYSA